jgi:superfamily II RNA helicase
MSQWIDKAQIEIVTRSTRQLSLDDMASSADFFLIHGDSLILQFVNHVKLNWTGPNAHFIQLTFYIEKLLQQLIERQQQFRIVFFDFDQINFCFSRGIHGASAESLQLYRTCLIGHLELNCPNVVVERFSHWWSEDWKKWALSHRPSFLLYHETSDCFRYSYTFCVQLLNHNVGLALMNDIEIDSRWIRTSCREAWITSGLEQLNKDLEVNLTSHFDHVCTSLSSGQEFTFVADKQFGPFTPPVPLDLTLVTLMDDILNGPREIMQASQSQWSCIVSALATRVFLFSDSSEEAQDLCKLFLLHIVMIEQMPMLSRPRSHTLPKETQNPFEPFLSRFAVSLQVCARYILSQTSLVNLFEWNLVDLIDSSWLQSIANFFKPFSGLKALDAAAIGLDLATNNKLESLWRLVIAPSSQGRPENSNESLPAFPPSNVDSSYFPLRMNHFEISDLNHEIAVSSQREPLELLPIRSPLVDRLLGPDVSKWIPEWSEKQVELFESQNNHKRFNDDYHWHSGRLIRSSDPMTMDYEEGIAKDITFIKQAWVKLGESLKSRSTQGALQPTSLMAQKSQQQDPLQEGAKESIEAKEGESGAQSGGKSKKASPSLQTNQSQSSSSNSAANKAEMMKMKQRQTMEAAQAKDEQNRITNLFRQWASSKDIKYPMKISKIVSAVNPKTPLGKYEFFHRILEMYREWKRVLNLKISLLSASSNDQHQFPLQTLEDKRQNSSFSDGDSKPPSISGAPKKSDYERTIKRDYYKELIGQCKAMIVYCCLRLNELRNYDFFKSAQLVEGSLEEFGLLNLIESSSQKSAAHGTATVIKKKVQTPQTAVASSSSSNPSKSSETPNSSNSSIPSKTLILPEDVSLASSTRFQMEFMGPWLSRDVGAVSDDRVKGGRLVDTWQVEVLNTIDKGESCLIVAPTSAGKTWMALHAMRRTLESSSDGILVYIAPTKVLVNQTLAEVYSEFSDEFESKLQPGTFLCGAFTRDYRVNHTQCRILVTVPQCLEILLLSSELERETSSSSSSSSSQKKSWRNRLNWVIFDEIHCIESDEGAVWERILPLIPCPFIALSATIGHPEIFQAWLQSLASVKRRNSMLPVKNGSASINSAHSSKKSIKSKDGTHTQNNKKAGAAKWEAQKRKHEIPAASSSSASGTTENEEPLVQRESEPNFKFIYHGYRYSDLYPYVVLPIPWKEVKNEEKMGGSSSSARSEDTIVEGQKEGERKLRPSIFTTELRAMHPWTGLHASHFQNSIPSINLAPIDTLKIYQAMAKVILHSQSQNTDLNITSMDEKDIVAFKELKPESFFGEGKVIDQKQTRRFEVCIKNLFAEWCLKYPEMAEKVLSELSGTVLKDLDLANQYMAPQMKSEFFEENPSPSPSSRKDNDVVQPMLLRSVMSLVNGLKKQDWLPALFFNFDRKFCENLALELLGHFLSEDSEWIKSSKRIKMLKVYQGRLDAYNATMDKISKRSARGDTLAPDDVPEMPSHPDLVHGKASLSQDTQLEDYAHEMSRLESQGFNLRLLEALRRGIGVHHAGLPKKYRHLVEQLFRSGHLKVVFATGTLAMGLNMPCKTVVFAGDSSFLTPLMYRQMSGRAGRRGYDPLGRVVFWGFTSHRITFLQGSCLSSLKGQFSSSTSWNLRALTLASGVPEIDRKKSQPSTSNTSSNTSSAEESVQLLAQVHHTSLYVHQDSKDSARKNQVALHTLCSLQLLARLSLINLSAIPQGFAGIAAHLHWEEPANLVLCEILTNPLLHEMCKTQGADGLMMLLCHLFSRKYIHDSEEWRIPSLKKEMTKTISDNFLFDLPPLDPRYQTMIDKHEQLCYDILNAVVRKNAQTFSLTKEEEQGKWLPFSQLRLPSDNPLTLKENALALSLEATKLVITSRSPCVAIGGLTDEISSKADLDTLRFPMEHFGLLEADDICGSQMKLNAYILNFYRHGNDDWLVKFNSIRRDDLYFVLGDFLLLLRTICAAVQHATTSTTQLVYNCFTEIKDKFEENYNRAFLPERRKLFRFTFKAPKIVIDLKRYIYAHTNKWTKVSSKPHPTANGRLVTVSCFTESDLKAVFKSFKAWANSDWTSPVILQQ